MSYGQRYTIPLNKNISQVQTAKLSQQAEKITYIPLETHPKGLIGRVYKIEYANNHLFIQDDQNTIFVFTDQGKYRSTINFHGKGPGEFVNISDFTIDPDHQEVLILAGSKILRFDFNAKFKEQFLCKVATATIGYLKDLYVVHTPMNYQETGPEGTSVSMVFFDRTGKRVGDYKSLLPNKLGENSRYLVYSYFQRFENHLLFREPFDNTVLRIDENMKVAPYILIDLGKKKIPQELYDDPENYRANRGKYVEFAQILELKTSILLRFLYQDKLRTGMFKPAKSTYTGFQTSSGEPGIENDLTNLPFKPLGNSISGDLISCYNAIDLIGKSANLKTKSINGCQIKSSVGTIGNNDNPIIEIVTLRK